MKNTSLIFTLLLATWGVVARSQSLTPEQLQADFARLRTALDEAHPAPYRYTSKSTFDSLATVTEGLLTHPMSRQEFYVALTPLLVALRDGHIKWLVPGRGQHYPFASDSLFPLKLYVVKDRAWVVGNYGPQAVSPGAELLAINGQPIAAVIGKLLAHMTFADGTTLNGKYEDLNGFFSGYYATFFGTSADFRVLYTTGGQRLEASLPGVTLDKIDTYEKAQPPSAQKPYEITFDDHSALLTVRQFWNDDRGTSFRRFLKDAFTQINARNYPVLILDLRDNEGGKETYGIALYRYLARHTFNYYDRIGVRQKKSFSFPAHTPKLYRMLRWAVVKKRNGAFAFSAQRGLKRQKPRKAAFKGSLYVLINGRSFSVTTELAARIQADGRGTFVGQETAGAFEGNNSGIFAITQLPNSKIDLGIPLFGFYMADLPEGLQKGQGIRPDHTVVPTAEDILAGRDPVLEYVRLHLRSEPPSALGRTKASPGAF